MTDDVAYDDSRAEAMAAMAAPAGRGDWTWSREETYDRAVPSDDGASTTGSRVGRVLVLASASSGRLSVLRNAGVEPRVVVSDVDEDAIVAAMPGAEPDAVVVALAVAKAEHVARLADPGDTVIGCDSMLLIDGELVGKPHDVGTARKRWAAMAGRSGELLTGHAVVRGERRASGVRRTVVRFAEPTTAELEAYLATGEPLHVAGAFTIDSLGGWFVEGVDGDPSSVVGISLPLTRRLLAEVGVRVTDLWAR